MKKNNYKEFKNNEKCYIYNCYYCDKNVIDIIYIRILIFSSREYRKKYFSIVKTLLENGMTIDINFCFKNIISEKYNDHGEKYNDEFDKNNLIFFLKSSYKYKNNLKQFKNEDKIITDCLILYHENNNKRKFE